MTVAMAIALPPLHPKNGKGLLTPSSSPSLSSNGGISPRTPLDLGGTTPPVCTTPSPRYRADSSFTYPESKQPTSTTAHSTAPLAKSELYKKENATTTVMSFATGYFTILKDDVNDVLFCKVSIPDLKDVKWLPLYLFYDGNGEYRKDEITIRINNQKFVLTFQHQYDQLDCIEVIDQPKREGPFTRDSIQTTNQALSLGEALDKRIKRALDQRQIFPLDVFFAKNQAKSITESSAPQAKTNKDYIWWQTIPKPLI